MADFDRSEFYTSNWDTLRSEQQGAWLYMFVLGEKVQFNPSDETFVLLSDGKMIVGYDHDVVVECERRISGDTRKLYVQNCLSEASAIAYEGLTPEQVQRPETAHRFYEVLLTLASDRRARCMYWAVRGERS